MKITSELLLEFQKHHANEFKFVNFGEKDLMWECYYNGNFETLDPRDSIIDFNPKKGELKMYTFFNLSYSGIKYKNDISFCIFFSNYCEIETWEEFEELIKNFKIWEKAALKFKKDIIIETKKVDCEGDFK